MQFYTCLEIQTISTCVRTVLFAVFVLPNQKLEGMDSVYNTNGMNTLVRCSLKQVMFMKLQVLLFLLILYVFLVEVMLKCSEWAQYF